MAVLAVLDYYERPAGSAAAHGFPSTDFSHRDAGSRGRTVSIPDDRVNVSRDRLSAGSRIDALAIDGGRERTGRDMIIAVGLALAALLISEAVMLTFTRSGLITMAASLTILACSAYGSGASIAARRC